MNELKHIPLSTPVFEEKERKFLAEAFYQKQIATSGDFIEKFESIMNDRFEGFQTAVLNSGTSAIHLALKLVGVGEGDEVMCQSLTFCATANPVIYLGARPVFVDSESDTWNICPESLERGILDRISKGKKPKAIISVDLFGMPAKYNEILAISEKYEIPVIEDAAEAMGSIYHGRPCGTWGTFGIFSFNGNKIITTGGGGALLSSNSQMIDKARYLAVQARENYKYYVHKEVGFNYRMNNISAAIGLAQISKLDQKISLRRKVYENYHHLLKEVPGISFLDEPENCFSNRWLSAILIDEKIFGYSNEDIRVALSKNKIEARYLWKPLHTQPSFEGCSFYEGGHSEKLFSQGLCLPSSEDLSINDQMRIVEIIKNLKHN